MHKLDKHQTIAVDLDDTLIYGNNSKSLQDYILDHPEKTFYLVTFRTKQEISMLPQEIKRETGYSLDEFGFERLSPALKVIPCTDRIHFEAVHDNEMRRKAKLPPLHQTKFEDMFGGEQKYVMWKGFVSKKLGATVLIDDMTFLVKPGTDRYTIELIHPNEIEYYSERE